MFCFLAPCPLPPTTSPCESLRIPRHIHHVPRQRRRLPTAMLKPATTAIPKFIPTEASKIVDPTAQAMLESLSLTSLPTSLTPAPIATSHLTQVHSSRNPAVVFLHGFDSSLLEFRRLHSVLSSDSLATLHYVDILGWGLTSRPREVSYGPAAKREHLKAFLDKFEADQPVILVGASLGAAIAVDFALEYPERVAKIVFIDGQVYMDRPKTYIPRFLASLGADVLRSRWLRKSAVQMSYVKDEFKSEDVLRIGGLHCVTDGWKEATIDFIMGEGYCVSERIAEVRDKSFVIWGEHDRVLPKAHLERFRKDDFPLVIARGCGHSPHIEDPVFVANYLRKIMYEC